MLTAFAFALLHTLVAQPVVVALLAIGIGIAVGINTKLIYGAISGIGVIIAPGLIVRFSESLSIYMNNDFGLLFLSLIVSTILTVVYPPDRIEFDQIKRSEIEDPGSAKIIEVDSASLMHRCSKLLSNKGYVLHSTMFGGYWIGEKNKKHVNRYSSSDLSDIAQWAIDAEDLSL